MPDANGYTGAGFDVPDGSTLNGIDDAGTAWIKGPQGNVVGVPHAALSDGSRAMLGISGLADAGAPDPVASSGGLVSPGSDLGQSVQAMAPASQPDAPAGPGLVDRALNFAGDHPALAAATFPVTGVLGPASAALAPSPDLQAKVGNHQQLAASGYVPPVVPTSTPAGPHIPTMPGLPTPPPTGARDFSGQANKAFAAEGDALGKEGDAQAALTQGRAANAATAAQQEAQAIQQAQQRRQAVVDEYKSHMAEVDKAQKTLDSQHEDPSHWWSTRDTGQKVAATLSMALAGFASGFTGHEVHSPVEGMIQRDIEAQRQNYMRSRDSIAAKRSAYGQLREQGLSDVDASLTLQRAQLDQAQKSLDAMLDQKYAPEAVKQNYAAQKAKLAQAQAQTDAQLQQSAAATAHERVATAEASQNMAIQKQGFELQQKLLANGQLPPQLAPRAVFVKGPDGRLAPMLAPDEKSAQQLKGMYGAAEGLLQEINEAKALAQQFGSSSNKTQAGAAYKAKLDAIISKLNNAEGINQAVGEEQRRLYMDTFGNATTTPSAATIKGLEGLESTLKTGVGTAFGANGLQDPYGYEKQQAAARDRIRKSAGGS